MLFLAKKQKESDRITRLQEKDIKINLVKTRMKIWLLTSHLSTLGKKHFTFINLFTIFYTKREFFMPISDKIKLLRKEMGFSQDELSRKIGTDGRQISLYENNKVAPSADTIVRISKVFNVSIDYLLIDDIVRRPLNVKDESIFERIQKMELLTEEEKQSVYNIIEGLAAKNKLKNAVHEII